MSVLFTQPYFAAQANGGIDQSVEHFVKDYWVFNAGRVEPLARSRYAQQVLALYEQDYIKAWDGLLDDLQLQPVTDIQGASAMAAKLSGPGSPLKALLQLVRDNTSDMLRSPAHDGAASGVATAAAASQAKAVGERLATRRALDTRLAGELRDAGATLSDGTPAVTAGGSVPSGGSQPGAAIEAHFAQLNQLSAGTPGSTPLDHTIGVLDQLSKSLLSMSDLGDPATQNNPAVLAARQEAGELPPQVAALVSGVAVKSASLVASGNSAALADQFRAAAGNDCARIVDGRYPFAASGASDIPLQNFTDLFGNGGRFDSFFKSTLSRFVDTSGRDWRWKPGVSSGPESMLSEAQAADAIRQIYFRNGAQLAVGFTLLAPQLDPAIAKLSIEIDGQKYDYSANGTASMSMTWPGPQPGHVVVSAFDASGQPVGAPLKYDGDWAFFHALDAGHLQKQGDLRYLASFDFAGHPAKLPIQPASLENPFLNDEVRRFRCPQ